MDSGGEASEPFAAVPHEEWLLRLNFNPEHIDNGKVVASAVSLTDLKTRGYSIDRERLIDVTIIAQRARDQAANKPEKRQAPFLSKFECGPVRGEVDTDGRAAFLVEASPVAGNETQRANPAHAHVKSAIHRGDAGLRQLRILLLPHLQRLIALGDYVRGAFNDDKVTPAAVSTQTDGANDVDPSPDTNAVG
ncbi:hypothetical protein MKK75_03830 [Methylobacterium sp. J-030]|uniref:hypothetical protein n=1 Tax=Methylobacterium sp. J-030 TaxID=2836627 RepID=UPI001FBC06FB|nr:hypothetical protein [Methylobacterium sp. J-030]MCJ2067945.1 hypothetical protein [Methylobacterium sp. J-030]